MMFFFERGVFLEVPDTVADPGFPMIFVSCTEYCQYSRDLSHTVSLVSFPPVLCVLPHVQDIVNGNRGSSTELLCTLPETFKNFRRIRED